jgi:hypothetical protein
VGDWTGAVKDATGRKGKGLFMPLRKAVTGGAWAGDGRRDAAFAEESRRSEGLTGSTQKALGPPVRPCHGWCMAQANAVFLKGNLFRHISVMSLTSSVGSDGRVPRRFRGHDLHLHAGQGRSLRRPWAMPGAILFFTTSVGIGMAIAGGALVARALGRR